MSQENTSGNGNGRKSRGVSSEQASAIRYKNVLANRIAKAFPYLGEAYEEGVGIGLYRGISGLADDFFSGLGSSYGIRSRDLADSAMRETLEILLGKDRFRELSKVNIERRNERLDERMEKEGRGRYGMTTEQLSSAGTKGANNNVREGKGCHGVKGEDRDKMYRKIVRKKGQIPYAGDYRDTDAFGRVDEEGYIIAARMSLDGEFRRSGGWKRVADEINEEWKGRNRTAQKCWQCYSNYFKREDSKK